MGSCFDARFPKPIKDSLGLNITGQVKTTAKFSGVINKNDPIYLSDIYAHESSVKLADPITMPTQGNTTACAFSPDGNYLAVVGGQSPQLWVYKRNGDTFVKLPDSSISLLPSSNAFGVTFSADGLYMAVTTYAGSYIYIYKRNGDTFTKLANPTILPTNNCYNVAFSSDGTYLAVGSGASPYIFIYKRNGDIFTKLADPSTLPTGLVHGVDFSPDGTYLTLGLNASHTFMFINAMVILLLN